MEIRCLEYADIPETVNLAYEMHQESAFSRFRFSPEKMAVNLSAAVTHPNETFCHVMVADGKVVGALFGYISEFLFGPDLIASDFGWFVLPEYRGSRSAVKLLKNFQAWAKANGAKEVAMGISTDVMPEKTGALLQKLGYVPVGGNYKLAI